MTKKRIQNFVIIVIAVLIIGSIITYNYSIDQTKLKGLQFGTELEQIQEEVKGLQTKFYSEKTRWEEGDITKEQLLEFYEEHLDKFKETISKYDDLSPPELFKGSVELLKISSEMQLESDKEFTEWIKTGDESAKIRSDTQFQDALEYEMIGLVEFYSAKTGVKNYDEPDKFEAPKTGLTQRVIQVSENMKNNCDKEFRNDSGGFDSNETESNWNNCIDDADKWKLEHLP